ncbi:MAG: hypothetical protein ACON4R_13935 [Akkermansiaceae bacterium]
MKLSLLFNLSRHRVFTLAGLLSLCSSLAAQQEVGFIEQFALAEDRAKALTQLIPGTEDYYYFHALHHQTERDVAALGKVMKEWKERFRSSSKRKMIENREALIRYSDNPEETIAYLKKELGLSLNHQQEGKIQEARHPSSLDQKLISWETWLRDSLGGRGDVSQIQPSGLYRFLEGKPKLDVRQRREVLASLSTPDAPGLVDLVLAELKSKTSKGFGEFNIHRALTKDQLDRLLEALPALRNDRKFVNEYLIRLLPGPDENMASSIEVREAYLERAEVFVTTLGASFNSLKAHILFQRLVHDRALGKENEKRFLAYLSLPRNVSYINPNWRKEKPEVWRYPANLGQDFFQLTKFPPAATNEEAVVKSYLLRYLKGSKDFSKFVSYLRDSWLRAVFAEAKITQGVGRPADWASLLPPAQFQALKDRVDIEFDPTSQEVFEIDDEVLLPVLLKNVPKLMVKVFEINTVNYYRKLRQEISTDIDLDGLVANVGEVFEYDRPSQLRSLEILAVKGIPKRRGLWVVELIGGGKSSRAVIRKGALGILSQTTSRGHLVTILDEKNTPLKGASVWLDGEQYDCDDKGRTLMPFSNSPGSGTVVVQDGTGFATLASILQKKEKYRLSAGFHLEQEALRTAGKTRVIVRPSLSLAGEPVSLKNLESASLEFASVNLDNTPVRMTVKDLKLSSDREFIHEFRVPDRVTALTVTLRTKVKVASQGDRENELTATRTFSVNQSEASPSVGDLFLSQIAGKYRVEFLGRNGEPLGERNLNLTLTHPQFKIQKSFTLKTTKTGFIDLGALEGISWITVAAPNSVSRSWTIKRDRRDQVPLITVRAGELLKVPFIGALNRREVAFFSLSGSAYQADEFSRLRLTDGYLNAQLPAGDYRLFFKKSAQTVTVMSAVGEESVGHVFNEARRLQLAKRVPSHLKELKVGKKSLEIEVAGLDPLTRIHLVGTRFVPGYDPFESLAGSERSVPSVANARFLPSLYVSGRNLGDELRYILERRYAEKFPGNMLARPEILLNPWAIRDTRSGQEVLEEGDRFARKPVPAPAANSLPFGSKRAEGKSGKEGQTPSFEFLANAPLVMANLVPDKNGKLTVDLNAFGDRQQIHVLLVDPDGATYRSVSLPDRQTRTRDLRLLANTLDAKRHFTEQNRVSFLKKEDVLKIPDLRSARFEVYDNLASVFRYYQTLKDNPVLRKFSFVVGWSGLPDEEKKAKYSEFACHELSFFLSRKDPAFFNEVVVPHLANKKDRTFMDDYLLGRPLKKYFEPFEYDRLNVVERILLSHKDQNRMEALRLDLEHLLAIRRVDPSLESFWFETGVGGGGFGGSRYRNNADPGMDKGGVATGAILGKVAMDSQVERPQAKEMAKESNKRKRALREMEKSVRRDVADDMEESLADDPFAPADGGDAIAIRQLYRALEPTKEWAENNYYQLPLEQQNGGLVQANRFWLDLARHGTGPGFGSGNLGAAGGSFTEVMFALSFLDLPFEAKEHQYNINEGTLNFTAKGNVLFFHREVKESGFAAERPPLLVSQSYFQLDDRYRVVNGQKIDKFITSEFVKGTVYGSQIVVTNPTSSTRQLDLLAQIPKGAIPVSGGLPTASWVISLKPYSTHRTETAFYFPLAGQFPVYPAHLSKEGKVVAHADGIVFKVVDQPMMVDKTSWAWISQWGTEKEVLDFLKAANLHAIDLGKVAWRCRENAKFFEQALTVLKLRGVYHPVIQGYAFTHNNAVAIRDYLMMQRGFLNQCGVALICDLVSMDPVNRRRFEHLEYRPLVNNRAHALGGENRILNPVTRNQYLSFLEVLSQRKSLDDRDHLGVTYYLFLQDRVTEALAHLSKVRPARLETRMQFDYFQAYAAFYQEDLGKARTVAKKYERYPVDRWRERFGALMGQIKEIEGVNLEVVKDGDRQQEQELAASLEPALALQVEGGKIKVSHQNIKEVTVNYYEMDLEFLFSTNPFVSSDSSRFDVIRPNKSESRVIGKGQKSTILPLPKEYQARNVIVEVLGGGKKVSRAVYANELRTVLSETMGLVTVRQGKNGRPLSKVYVKVYADTNQGPVFFKDGYTDLRGKFDYASVSTQGLGKVRKFSILVMSEDDGATVLEARAPRR